MDESKLIQSTLRGDRRAFNDLVTVYHRPLMASARYLLSGIEDAEDLVQETLLAAYRRLNNLRDADKFKPWVFTILRNKCLRYLQRHQIATVPLDEDHETMTVTTELPDSSLQELMAQLSPADRQMLSARYLQGLNYSEIARQLHITEHNARMRCLRARERLRKLVISSEEELRQVMRNAFSSPTCESSSCPHSITENHADKPIRAAHSMLISGGWTMMSQAFRYHLTAGLHTTYRCVDTLVFPAKDNFYVIRYDRVEKTEQLANDSANISVDFPNFHLQRLPLSPVKEDVDQPPDSSTLIRQTLQRHANGGVHDVRMHYTEGAFIGGMGEVIDAMARGIRFPDSPVQIGQSWDDVRSTPDMQLSIRHQLADIGISDQQHRARIISTIGYVMPLLEMYKAPEDTETRGYAQTVDLHVETLFNITDGCVEQRTYAGSVCNDLWLLAPERRHVSHEIISVSGKADHIACTSGIYF